MGSIAKRFVLTIWDGLAGSLHDLAGPGGFWPTLPSGLLAEVHGLALDAIQSCVQPCLICRTRGVAAESLTVYDQGQLDYVRVGGASVLFIGQLNQDLGLLVLKTLEPTHLSIGVLPHGFRNLDVLALDDHPHGRPPKTRCASWAGGWPAATRASK
jgi:hypothetical protein